jgi:hypothetical protein
MLSAQTDPAASPRDKTASTDETAASAERQRKMIHVDSDAHTGDGKARRHKSLEVWWSRSGAIAEQAPYRSICGGPLGCYGPGFDSAGVPANYLRKVRGLA